ncbi:glycosyl hydrolase [Lacibacter luteus]|uniref:Glycosyl hydrolase n=2 Tax=Lacibacter luteus TaxID=2508719 RepID=A0A4Q1CP43_9BACT|nr:glycosyl hydrolase [Lacibacter luteus]
MKKFSLLVILLMQLLYVRAQSDSVYIFAYFKNNGQDGLHLAYSNDGFKWSALKKDSSFLKPTVAKDKLMRDPCIIRGADGLFHMVWTVSWNDRGIGYASSKDLIYWSEQRFIPVMMHEDSARNCWAPEITYDGKSKQYMIYWATTIKGKYPADPKVENGYNHRMYYVLTKNFSTFSKTKMLYDKGFNVIDATIVPDGKQFVMFLKDETREPAQKNIKIATSKKLRSGYTDASAPITGNYWAEGPTTLRINGTWIVYFDKYRDHKYGAVQSTDLKNWTDISDKISLPSGIRHGTIFTISKAEFELLPK